VYTSTGGDILSRRSSGKKETQTCFLKGKEVCVPFFPLFSVVFLAVTGTYGTSLRG
jgi:hypothetical protein